MRRTFQLQTIVPKLVWSQPLKFNLATHAIKYIENQDHDHGANSLFLLKK
jgi:hypothetical protein